MDTRSRAFLALGLVLLSVPLWAPFLDVTGTDYVYERANVTVAGEELSVDAPPGTAPPSEQIACFGDSYDESERLCRIERALTEGNVTATTTTVEMSGSARAAGAPFVVFSVRGQPYQRLVSFDDTSDRYAIGLEPVDPATVLETVSYDGDRRSGPIARTLETGSARSEVPLEEPRLYDHESEYVLVYQEGTRQFLSAKPLVERGFETIAIGSGALLVFRVGRRSRRI